jgi:hypothetical protein
MKVNLTTLLLLGALIIAGWYIFVSQKKAAVPAPGTEPIKSNTTAKEAPVQVGTTFTAEPAIKHDPIPVKPRTISPNFPAVPVRKITGVSSVQAMN